jgi:DNA polymerase III epsilon subunit-like protein
VSSSNLPDLAFIDVETLGLDPEKHRVIEITVTRVPFDVSKWGSSPRSITQRITPTPEDFALAESGALRVNGYYPGHPDWAGAIYSRSTANSDFWNNLNHTWLKDAVLVSQNVPFDRGFLESELLERWSFTPKPGEKPRNPGLWARRFIDIQSYSALIAMEKGLSKWGLHDVYAALGLPALPEHRSAADVQRGMAVFKYVYDRVMRTS